MSCPCHECHATQLAAILQDLIAELRHSAEHYSAASDDWLASAADRAEARLREVQGE